MEYLCWTSRRAMIACCAIFFALVQILARQEYYQFKTQLTWYEAKVYCELINMNLFTIDDILIMPQQSLSPQTYWFDLQIPKSYDVTNTSQGCPNNSIVSKVDCVSQTCNCGLKIDKNACNQNNCSELQYFICSSSTSKRYNVADTSAENECSERWDVTLETKEWNVTLETEEWNVTLETKEWNVTLETKEWNVTPGSKEWNVTSGTKEWNVTSGKEMIIDARSSSISEFPISSTQSSVKSSSKCYCKCSNTITSLPPTRETLTKSQHSKQLQELVKELTVDKKSTSADRRKKTSAPDERPLAKYIGYVGIVILCSVFGGIFIMDLGILLREFRGLIHNISGCCHHKKEKKISLYN